jgi:hypothetical protein
MLPKKANYSQAQKHSTRKIFKNANDVKDEETEEKNSQIYNMKPTKYGKKTD